jgi:uncharacterized ion transporter superfamily protein YfcC
MGKVSRNIGGKAMEKENARVMDLNIKSFVGALVMLLILMVLTYALTFVVPSGSYKRELVDGVETIVAGTYEASAGGISLWRWLLSPVLVIGAKGGVTIIAIVIFLLIIGGAFTALDCAGVMSYMLSRIYSSFENKRYKLLAIVTLFFMALGSLVGSFEETVPLVAISVALAYSMGWDALVGLGMSLLAVGCGFTTGICNPFTVGVAQELAGLPMFSGMSFRIISFVIVYAMLLWFLMRYAKKIEKDPEKSPVYDRASAERWTAMRVDFVQDNKKDKALKLFCIILSCGVLLILCSSFIPILQDIIMPVIGLVFLLAGTCAVLASGSGVKKYLGWFKKGMVSILPAVLLILMASSIKYTLMEANILDTMLYKAVGFTESMSPAIVILIIYVLVLGMDLFISSGSAKAFLLIPLIAPLADLSGISRQLTVLAYAYGDGFSNIFYPTNPVLLISLGIVGVSYGKWAKWSIKILAPIFLITALILVVGLKVGY